MITAYEIPRDVVRVAGPEAAAYLQGQLSQDVEGMAPGSSRYSFVLQPTGKVDSWGRVTRLDGESFMLDVDGGHGEALVARLRRFLLRTKAEVEPLEDLVCVGFRGPGAEALGADGGDLADLGWVNVMLRQPVRGPGGTGIDVIALKVGYPDDVTVGTSEEYEAARIAAGVPAMGAELTEKTIPAEVGQWIVEESVDFAKGCFTGQELVARIDSRGGNVPRHLRGLVVEGTTLPPSGASVMDGGKKVGEVTSSAVSQELGRPVALAYVARAVDPPADGVVTWTEDESGGDPIGEVPVRVQALPLTAPR